MQRVGDRYRRMDLLAGKVININRYVSLNAGINIRPHTYYFCFGFSDASKGIGLYTVTIILDNNGNLVNAVNLPDVNNEPHKLNIISLPEAVEIAREYHFYDLSTKIKIDYDFNVGSIVWKFQRFESSAPKSQTLVIDAHNKQVIGILENEGLISVE